MTLAVLIFLFCCGCVFAYGILTCDRLARTLPSYERVDISPILEKRERGDALTDEEYDTLSAQTGILVRDVLDSETNERLLAFQEAFFFAGEIRHEEVVPGCTYHDMLFDPDTGEEYVAPMVKLEAGDVLISETSHTLGWPTGHAALVLDRNYLLQAAVIGTDSIKSTPRASNSIPWFETASNFMVLRLKNATAEERKEIADNAEKHLIGVPYHFVAGVFTPKDQGEKPYATTCSHLVWQAFKYFGYDIDADGGPVCTPRDIANSPYFEVVQIYGFDPAKGW